MSMIEADGRKALLTRVDAAEVLGGGSSAIKLLADSDTTEGAVSANRTLLRPGADGPPPHYHNRSAEIFFLVSGSLQALAGDRVVRLRRATSW
jgi:mannose-6-phosphate isomerase-like protein (cupin superfamily)